MRNVSVFIPNEPSMCLAGPDRCGFAREPDITTAGSDME